MSRERGFTLVELLFALAIVTIALSVATPSFTELLRNQRARTATHELRQAIDFTRESAVHSGRPISIVAIAGNWANGWEVMVDADNTGTRSEHKPLLASHATLNGIRVLADSTSSRYLHFTPRGNGIQPNGAFHSGTLTICGEGSSHYRIVINKAGRIREEVGDTSNSCSR
ncbi:GspH/FimT family pseudopilin [Pseudomonas nitroreducens]|uniref:GspH/FimT family pseudopilin n=1 Tax=Pseudomonas TaxID=286 RepID=UPI001CF05FAF|nr:MULTISPECIES: GspH/FimT family pseudopilin [Pseudomonas]MDG9853661.1 GspH/FimT family pseudopilin [Pseudomonas nitroreducens]MDH1076068.1 GspH/FimT family pseudopilin [Pseudomonas nitroreducens]UCL88067.1 GspH/FimT family pseudopilin [Pseudomonas sp. HS-18]